MPLNYYLSCAIAYKYYVTRLQLYEEISFVQTRIPRKLDAKSIWDIHEKRNDSNMFVLFLFSISVIKTLSRDSREGDRYG